MKSVPISVLIPYRNAESTLGEAIESVLGQSFSEFELILVNDGSSDASLDVVLSYSHCDSRIVSHMNPGVGIVDALNAGVSISRSTWIARMDADDICHPDRLGKQLAVADEVSGLSVVGCRVEVFPEQSITAGMRHYIEWLNGLDTPARIANEIWVESPVAHPSAMIRRDALAAVGGYIYGDFPEDYDLWLRLHNAGHRFGKATETLLYWRDNPSRLSRLDSRYRPEAFRKLKARHLVLGPLQTRREVQIWGAGPDGKAWGRVLEDLGVRITRYLDVDPRKIGGKIRGVTPVVSYESAPQRRDLFLLGAVGAKGARSLVRAALQEMGFRETEDYLFVQ
ncbi:MAG: glycosyltransferase [Myxococcales bacterium]|nr:glycosyltransferase [Myxococcales bacterium]